VRDSNSTAAVSYARGQEPVGSTTCGFGDQSVTARARCCPWFARRLRTQRGPAVVAVPSGRGRLRRSGPPRPGTDRPAGHGKADAKPRPHPYHSCCRAPIEEPAQVRVTQVTVNDRQEPHEPALYGTQMARSAGERECALAWRRRHQLACGARPVLGDHLPRWQAAEGGAAGFGLGRHSPVVHWSG